MNILRYDLSKFLCCRGHIFTIKALLWNTQYFLLLTKTQTERVVAFYCKNVYANTSQCFFIKHYFVFKSPSSILRKIGLVFLGFCISRLIKHDECIRNSSAPFRCQRSIAPSYRITFILRAVEGRQHL